MSIRIVIIILSILAVLYITGYISLQPGFPFNSPRNQEASPSSHPVSADYYKGYQDGKDWYRDMIDRVDCQYKYSNTPYSEIPGQCIKWFEKGSE